MPPVLDSIILRFSKNCQEPELCIRPLAEPRILVSGQEKINEEPECTKAYMRIPSLFLTNSESKRQWLCKRSTVCMTTHTLARDLRKDAIVSGVEVTSFFWNDTNMALKLVFADMEVPDLMCEPMASLDQRSVRVNLQKTIDQLILRPIKNEFQKLEAEISQDGRVLYKHTLDSTNPLCIVRDNSAVL